MEKDKSMCEPIVRGLIKYFPWTSTNKVVLFIHELEEILELAHPGVMDTLGSTCLKLIMETISKCISSPHFQIAERMLFLWNNQYLTSPDALLGTSYTKEVLPLVIGALTANAGPDDDDGTGPSGMFVFFLNFLVPLQRSLTVKIVAFIFPLFCIGDFGSTWIDRSLESNCETIDQFGDQNVFKRRCEIIRFYFSKSLAVAT